MYVARTGSRCERVCSHLGPLGLPILSNCSSFHRGHERFWVVFAGFSISDAGFVYRDGPRRGNQNSGTNETPFLTLRAVCRLPETVLCGTELKLYKELGNALTTMRLLFRLCRAVCVQPPRAWRVTGVPFMTVTVVSYEVYCDSGATL